MNDNEAETLKENADSTIDMHQHGTQCRHGGFERGTLPPDHVYVPHKQTLYLLFINAITLAENTSYEIFNNATSSFDQIISRSDFHAGIKRLLHAKQILLFLFIFNNQLLLSNIEPSSFLLYTTFLLMLGSIIFLYIFSAVYWRRGSLQPDESMEKFIKAKNPDCAKNSCAECKVLKCMRAVHCNFCNVCVTKFEFHSDWFNICIGGYNNFLYFISMAAVHLYFLISFLLMVYDIFFTSKCQGNELAYHSWLLVFVIIVYKSGRFYYRYIRCSVRNLTAYENANQPRLAYLARDSSREYFNPFDKGAVMNLKEMFFTFINGDMGNDGDIHISISSKDDDDGEYDIDLPKKEEEDNSAEGYMMKQLRAFVVIVRLCKPFQPFISAEGNVYKSINGHTDIINWNRIRLFTFFDLENSPFKEILLKQAKIEIGKYKQFHGRNMSQQSPEVI